MLKRATGIALILISVMAVSVPATAKKAPKQKPVKTILYLEGTMDVGDAEQDPVSGVFLQLSPDKPDGVTPKSKALYSYAVGPNPDCAGNSLFPVFIARDFAGTVVGPVKFTINTVSSPGASVDLRIWPDIASQMCDSETTGAMDYVEPGASVVAPLPPGPGVVEVKTPNAKFEAQALLMFQITPILVPPFMARVLYDAETYDSRIEFMCIPPKGAKSCV